MRTDTERQQEARILSHTKPPIDEYIAIRVTTRRSDRVPRRDEIHEQLKEWEKKVVRKMLKDAEQSPVLKINTENSEFSNMLMWNLARENTHIQGPTVLFPETVRLIVIKNPILFTQLIFQVCYGDSLDDVYDALIREMTTKVPSTLNLPKKSEVELAFTSILLLISEITYGKNIFRDYLNSYGIEAPGLLQDIQKVYFREIQKKLPHNSWFISMLGSQSQENLVHHVAREFVTKKLADRAIVLKTNTATWQANPLIELNPEFLTILKQETRPGGYVSEVRDYLPDRPYAKFDTVLRELREMTFQYIYEYYRSFSKRNKQKEYMNLYQLQDRIEAFIRCFKKDNPEKDSVNSIKSRSLIQDMERITDIMETTSLNETLMGLFITDGRKRSIKLIDSIEKFCSIFLSELEKGVLYPPRAVVESLFGKYSQYAYFRQKAIALIVSYLTLVEPELYRNKNQYFAKFYNMEWVTIFWGDEEEFSLELHHTTIENNTIPYNVTVRDFMLEIGPLMGRKPDDARESKYISDLILLSQIPLSDVLKTKLQQFYIRLWDKILKNEKARLIPVVEPTEMLIKTQYYWLNFIIGHLSYIFPEVAEKYGFEQSAVLKKEIRGRSRKKRIIRIGHNSVSYSKEIRLSMNFLKYLRSCAGKDPEKVVS